MRQQSDELLLVINQLAILRGDSWQQDLSI